MEYIRSSLDILCQESFNRRLEGIPEQRQEKLAMLRRQFMERQLGDFSLAPTITQVIENAAMKETANSNLQVKKRNAVVRLLLGVCSSMCVWRNCAI